MKKGDLVVWYDTSDCAHYARIYALDKRKGVQLEYGSSNKCIKMWVDEDEIEPAGGHFR